MKPINIYTFCSQLVEGKLDEQITELQETAEEQLSYIHPLKQATVAEQHALGRHNQKAAELINQLKEHLLNGKEIVAN